MAGVCLGSAGSVPPVTDPGGQLDATDRAILGELQEDGRRPFREIARNIGVSERTIRARVRALHDAGALRILAFVDPSRFGHSVLALVFLRVRIDAHDAIVEELTSWPEVSYVSSLMGRHDLCVQVIARDVEGLWDLVNHRLRGLDGVTGTETLMEMAVHKFRYSYPGIAD
ncbi:MAG: Lrp/AsnC family transcriptional regulator, regulator for asnA, asnC and gidA [Solirubrobacteraceae bacterium]|nr:Lrp/AsnC family transcriptional regulator, regulator for asnA, asnC and gidA [Solirubrobacteraceae bacterium]